MNAWQGHHYPAVARPEIARELYLTSVGRSVHPAGEAYPSPGHPDDYQFKWQEGRILGDYIALWLESGAGVVEAAGLGRTELRPGTCLFLPPGVWHRYRPDPKIGWVERWVCVNGHYMHHLSRQGVFPTRALLRPIVDPEALEPMFMRLGREGARGGWRAAALALALLALLTEEPEPRTQAWPDTDAPAADALVRTVVDFIWSNCHRRLDIGGLAKRFGISRRALERRFATAWNRSVAREITRARVSRGRDLLAQPGMTVKEAGYAAGFGGPRRFIEAHRRLLGSTPGKIRRAKAV